MEILLKTRCFLLFIVFLSFFSCYRSEQDFADVARIFINEIDELDLESPDFFGEIQILSDEIKKRQVKGVIYYLEEELILDPNDQAVLYALALLYPRVDQPSNINIHGLDFAKALEVLDLESPDFQQDLKILTDELSDEKLEDVIAFFEGQMNTPNDLVRLYVLKNLYHRAGNFGYIYYVEQKIEEALAAELMDQIMLLFLESNYDEALSLLQSNREQLHTWERIRYLSTEQRILDATQGTLYLEFDRLYLPEFVLVEAGSFLMGNPGVLKGNSVRDRTQHQVTLTRDFYMAKTEVSVNLWIEVMGEEDLVFPNDEMLYDFEPGGFPWNRFYEVSVTDISWQNATEFCNLLSSSDGLTPCYSGSGDSITCDFDANGYRLPTEAEWEYAARGGQQAAESFLYAGSNHIDEVAWYEGDGVYSPFFWYPGGLRAPNALGLYDMSGNVSEMCWDFYAEYVGDEIDPLGPDTGTDRVLRGGSWRSDESQCRLDTRMIISSNNGHNTVGLRLVRTR